MELFGIVWYFPEVNFGISVLDRALTQTIPNNTKQFHEIPQKSPSKSGGLCSQTLQSEVHFCVRSVSKTDIKDFQTLKLKVFFPFLYLT